MKTIRIFGLSIVLMMASLLSPHMAAVSLSSDAEDTPILIRQDSPVPEGGPRTGNPFFAELSADFVILGASSSCGNVTVTLTSTAGDWYQTVFDTGDGILYIPVSGDSGYYSLSITTSGGAHYFGEFTI